MAIIHVLTKSGKELLYPVTESLETIQTVIDDEYMRAGHYIQLTNTTGKKILFQKRYIFLIEADTNETT